MDKKLSFSDVMILPKYNPNGPNSRKNVNLVRKFKFDNGAILEAVPIIAANLDTVGCEEIAKNLAEEKVMTALHKHHTLEELIEIFKQDWSKYCFYTLGITEQDKDKLDKFCNKFGKPQLLCFDVANALIPKTLEYIKKLREDFHSSVILAGNVCTREGLELLKNAGTDIVKAGIGGGGLCKTSEITGVGYPQYSMLKDIRYQLIEVKLDKGYLLPLRIEKFNSLICSDGGCKVPGDICKALSICDMVMVGSMFSGCTECSGEWTYAAKLENSDQLSGCGGVVPRLTGEWVKKELICYGMSSEIAMNKYGNGIEDYRASEGKTMKIPNKGPVKKVIQEILGGIRSACTYLGVSDIKDMEQNAEFIKV